jgi:hypothetical protein
VEWVVQDIDENTTDKHTTVNWSYTLDEGYVAFFISLILYELVIRRPIAYVIHPSISCSC